MYMYMYVYCSKKLNRMKNILCNHNFWYPFFFTWTCRMLMYAYIYIMDVHFHPMHVFTYSWEVLHSVALWFVLERILEMIPLCKPHHELLLESIPWITVTCTYDLTEERSGYTHVHACTCICQADRFNLPQQPHLQKVLLLHHFPRVQLMVSHTLPPSPPPLFWCNAITICAKDVAISNYNVYK